MPETLAAHEAFDGLALSELPIEEVIWSDERARHIRTRRDRKGSGEVDLEPEWATEVALDPHRLVARGNGRSSIQVVGYFPGARRVLLVWIWTTDHPPTHRPLARGQRHRRRAPDHQHLREHQGQEMTDIDVAAEDAAVEARAADDDPEGLIAHLRPPKAPSQVYTVRIPTNRLAQLRQLADERGIPPSALLRSWAIAHLDAEQHESGSGHRMVSEAELLAVLRTVVREEFAARS